jgi:short-subunit dehydrogenase
MSSKFTPIDSGRFGPWALVTGSSSGIGKELARQVAASGIHVVMAARRQHLLDDLGRQLAKDFGVQYRTVGVDLTREDFLDPIRAATDDLDVGLLISNAGAPLVAEFVDTPVDSLLRQIRLDVSAPLQLIRHFAPRLARRGRGGLILVSAMGAAQGLPLAATGAAGKSFLLSLGYGLHHEFARLGLNTTVLIPGPTDTPVLGMLGMDPARMPIKPIPAGVSAAEALAALVANRPSHISGRITRLVYRLMPTSVSTRIARSMLANAFAARIAHPRPGVIEGGQR